MDPDLVSKFASLFWGRTDVWFDSDKSFQVKGQVTINTIRKHLTGEKPIGTYPVLDNSNCRWGCIDIDEENLSLARDLQSVWRYFDIESHCERSRSKGYHVWIFSREWISAQVFRRAGLFVEYIATETNRLEVNPKAEAPWLSSVKYINTVRLPYDGSRVSNARTVVISPRNKPISLERFVDRAWQGRTGHAQLAAVAGRWAALERERRLVNTVTSDAPVRTGNSARTQDAWHILEGLRQVTKGERDNQLYTVARLLHGSGVPYELALSKMSKIWAIQLEDHSDYSERKALEKIERIYRG